MIEFRRRLLVDEGEGDEGTSVLPLGQVMVAQFAGIIDAERNFAEESGTDVCRSGSPGRIIL